MTIRTFVAIEIDKEIKDRILEFLNQLKKVDADVKWVASENIHITLKFIGYIDEKILPALNKTINDITSCLRSFSIKIEDVGVFPTLKKPRIIFVCARDKENNLLKLYEELENRLEVLGIKRESRKYVGHITLGRIKSQKNIPKLIDTLNSRSGHFFGQEKANYISLIQSKLTPSGPVYTRLKNFELY